MATGRFFIQRIRASDPKRPKRFPESGLSAKPRFCEQECSEAAFGDLTHPATTCRWLLHLDCSRSTELNGRYPATKSTAEISVPGH